MKNIWHIADKLVEKFNERSADIWEFEDFDDYAIENLFEKTLDELLLEQGITKEQALLKSETECKLYLELADKLEVKSLEFPQLWIDLIKQCENEQTEDNIKLLLWLTAGGSFADTADDELTAKEAEDLSIRQWLGVNERKKELETHFVDLKENVTKFGKMLANIDRIKTVQLDTTIDSNVNDVNQVFFILTNEKDNNAFIKKDENMGELKNNLAVISQLINTYSFLKPIKPLVYFQVYVRQRRKLLTAKGYIPNFKSIFESKKYKVYKNNEKNYKKYYAEYCRLYILLKGSFPDSDEKLCDMGFICCSNLASWYHELGYMGYSCNLPDGIPYPSYDMVRKMSVLCFDEPMCLDDIEEWGRQYQNLYIEAVNAVDDIRFEELGEFAELGEKFCDKLFNENLRKNIRNEDQHKAAWGLLVRETEQRFNELLEEKISDIFVKYFLNV